jgi:hypothetical protein
VKFYGDGFIVAPSSAEYALLPNAERINLTTVRERA